MLNNIGPAGFIIIAVVVLVLFGRGKVSALMGEVGKGITSFKKGLKDGTDEIEKKDDDASKTARDITPETDKDNGKDRV
ncbi:MAG: sec-independent protein translocase protein TatA [Roseibaca calidilacus]|uniref:Sec-independent protein translocase protein TatA n=1 Tax=Roseibaca calidilacus TaxID=1666912 RepID=A0A0P7WNT7_9RHOB|nr:twin-arginine translocase TatA/TatE family subunit [Roseibaca calidilacus]KPP95670.1 MAG: sec-independent protein translocase protein TatA [Roseibaca calidilacus]CUX81912.1 sec-independent protein translocase protein TatA [Roseibaca calidilacus]